MTMRDYAVCLYELTKPTMTTLLNARPYFALRTHTLTSHNYFETRTKKTCNNNKLYCIN